MSRPATTAEWNADRAASEKEFSPVKLPRFNALRREAKIVVYRKRFLFQGMRMNNSNTNTSAARDAGQEVITITTCSTRAKAESLLARGQWIHAVDRCTFKVQGYAEAGQMITSTAQVTDGDTVTWVNGFGGSETATVFTKPGFHNTLRVRLSYSDCSVQHLLNIHGSLCLNAR